ncbi:MAG: M64 family metallopeptidase, partial [Clostridia bacterium]|nr:M64 family metallopeptidase [Clostridia bacterium]
MKKSFIQFEAILLGIIFMFSFFSPITIQAEQEEKTSFPMYVIHKTGNDNENFVILIMGDGYTADQQEQFIKDAADKANGMLKWSPYKEYSDRINIYAMQVVSAESGLGELYGDGPDTYFNLRAYGSIIGFTNGGETKARALRSEIENNYLDEGASVGTTHIISNSTVNLAVSSGVAFSFSTNASQNSTGTAMTHEISHSIGKLGDEYSNKTNYPNISNTADANSIKWSKLLGFGGVGITNAGTSSVFAPSTECMMRELGRDFCEVCKMELAWKLNNTDFVKYPAKKMYVANPEITLEHNRISTLGSQIEKYRITEKNITKANNQDIEFRTVVQNMENRERHLKISLDILASDGKTVKFSNEKEYTVPALTNSYSPNDARESLSVKLTPEYLTYGDKINGKIIDTDTGEVLATDKTASQKWGEIHIRFKSKSNLTDIPNTATATVYVPINSTYTLRNPEISGYTLVGNSVGGNSVKITEANTDITYYYRDKNSSHTHTWSDWKYNNDAVYNSKTDYTDGTATR